MVSLSGGMWLAARDMNDLYQGQRVHLRRRSTKAARTKDAFHRNGLVNADESVQKGLQLRIEEWPLFPVFVFISDNSQTSTITLNNVDWRSRLIWDLCSGLCIDDKIIFMWQILTEHSIIWDIIWGLERYWWMVESLFVHGDTNLERFAVSVSLMNCGFPPRPQSSVPTVTSRRRNNSRLVMTREGPRWNVEGQLIKIKTWH